MNNVFACIISCLLGFGCASCVAIYIECNQSEDRMWKSSLYDLQQRIDKIQHTSDEIQKCLWEIERKK